MAHELSLSDVDELTFCEGCGDIISEGETYCADCEPVICDSCDEPIVGEIVRWIEVAPTNGRETETVCCAKCAAHLNAMRAA